MKLGLSSYTYTWAVGVPGYPVPAPLSAVDLVRRAHGFGLAVVQFADNLPLDRLSPADLDELETVAAELGVAIEVGTRGIGDHVSRYVSLAERFGSPFVRLVIDSGDDQPSVDEAIIRLNAYAPTFRAANVSLAIENHDRFTTTQLLQVVDSLGPWAGICLDTVNSLGCLQPPDAVVAALMPRALNVHVKDFTIHRHPSQMGFEVIGAPAGSGMLDIPAVLCAAHEAGTVHSAILELWTPPTSAIAETVATEAAWAERSIGYLRAQRFLQEP